MFLIARTRLTRASIWLLCLVCMLSLTASAWARCEWCKWNGKKKCPHNFSAVSKPTGQVAATVKSGVAAVIQAPHTLHENSINVLCETAFFAFRNHVTSRNGAIGSHRRVQPGSFLHRALQPLSGRLDVTAIRIIPDAYVPGDNDAVTFGGTIYVKGPWEPDDVTFAALLGHEMMHSVQYARFGDSKDFARAYMRDIPRATLLSLSQGSGFDQFAIHDLMKLEIEARSMQQAVRQRAETLPSAPVSIPAAIQPPAVLLPPPVDIQPAPVQVPGYRVDGARVVNQTNAPIMIEVMHQSESITPFTLGPGMSIPVNAWRAAYIPMLRISGTNAWMNLVNNGMYFIRPSSFGGVVLTQ